MCKINWLELPPDIPFSLKGGNAIYFTMTFYFLNTMTLSICHELTMNNNEWHLTHCNIHDNLNNIVINSLKIFKTIRINYFLNV